MHKFEIYLKSGQTLTWHCGREDQAEEVRDRLEKIVFDPKDSSSYGVMSLSYKKSKDQMVFLEKDVVAFSYKNNVMLIKGVSVVSGVNLDGVHSGPVTGGMLADTQSSVLHANAKNEEETE